MLIKPFQSTYSHVASQLRRVLPYGTYGHEVLVVPGLQLRQGPAVQQQSVGHVGDELQGHVALETRHHGRKPGIAVSVETVLVLLALGPLELSRALAPWRYRGREEIKMNL